MRLSILTTAIMAVPALAIAIANPPNTENNSPPQLIPITPAAYRNLQKQLCETTYSSLAISGMLDGLSQALREEGGEFNNGIAHLLHHISQKMDDKPDNPVLDNEKLTPNKKKLAGLMSGSLSIEEMQKLVDNLVQTSYAPEVIAGAMEAIYQAMYEKDKDCNQHAADTLNYILPKKCYKDLPISGAWLGNIMESDEESEGPIKGPISDDGLRKILESSIYTDMMKDLQKRKENGASLDELVESAFDAMLGPVDLKTSEDQEKDV
jgi:hypothetical protein